MRCVLVVTATLAVACGGGATDGDGGGSTDGAGDGGGDSDATSAEGSGDAADETSADTESTGDTGDGPTDGTETTGGEDPEAWLDRPLREQVEAADSGALSCAGLTDAYLARMDALDEGAEGINAMLARDPLAPSDATDLDGAAGAGALLHCGVIALKDNIDSLGMVTTAGSLAMVDNMIDADAPFVGRMRDAGALLIGKSNLSEWANFRGYGSSSGWSSVDGQTRNGAAPDYNPCGSSSGSAAAVAAGLVSAAIGTETNGSITCPASVNGVVGMKPTVGLVSRTGVVPISHTQDTAGPMTRTVGDAARLLRVMAGPDPADPATDAIPPGLDLDFEALLETASFAGARVGVDPAVSFQFDGATLAIYDAQVAKIEAAGATIVDITMPNPAAFSSDQVTILTYEFKADLNAYLAAHPQPGQAATLQELIDFNQQNAATVMPHFGQEWFTQSQATTGLDAPEYLNARAQAAAAAGENGIRAVMDGQSLDVIVLPTTDPAWVTNYVTGDQPGGSSSSAAAVAGYPHLTVPMGDVGGRPVGLSFIARAWEDGQVLAFGHAYEQLR